jgi:hypothetical protein
MVSILSGNLFFSEGIANGLRQVNPPPPVAVQDRGCLLTIDGPVFYNLTAPTINRQQVSHPT